MEETLSELEKLQKTFLIILSSILVIGIIMVFSSSYMYSMDVFGNPSFIFLKQLFFALLGSLIAFIVYKTKISFWIKYAPYIHMTVVFFLLLTIIPGFGITTKGSSRWVNILGLGFQPGELVKYTIMLIALKFFDQFNILSNKQKVTYGAWILIPLVLLIMQPDFGTFIICSVVITFVCFISSFPRKFFYSSLPIGVVIGVVVLMSQPYRVRRLFSFLDPWKDPSGSGFQIIQSLYGFANGSLIGQGLGNSNEKLFYLPEAHNDFIFSVIGEEVGYLGVLAIILLYLAFVYTGFKITFKITERLNAILIACVVFTIGLQALVNMGVVLGMLPTKGLNLPFISYGGTSLITNLFGLGLIFSAIRSEKKKLQPQTSHDSFLPGSGEGELKSPFPGRREEMLARGRDDQFSRPPNNFSGF